MFDISFSWCAIIHCNWWVLIQFTRARGDHFVRRNGNRASAETIHELVVVVVIEQRAASRRRSQAAASLSSARPRPALASWVPMNERQLRCGNEQVAAAARRIFWAREHCSFSCFLQSLCTQTEVRMKSILAWDQNSRTNKNTTQEENIVRVHCTLVCWTPAD